jgi:ABC-type transport system involved in multi-copper enzyme maturation permease subunit
MTMVRIAQAFAVFRLEWKKSFFARRGLWIYLLAMMPIVLFAGHSIVQLETGRPCDFGLDTTIFATVFQVFYLRLLVFFGCVGIFMNLFRGEVLDRSLHFYFLAPVRREVIMAGKFAAGLTAAVAVFCTSTLLQFAAMYAHYPTATIREYLLHGNGLMHLVSYVGVTALACLGYGSVFTAAGIRYRNPIIPAATIVVWEAINGFLPAMLQKFSIIYYLKSLCPIEISPDVPKLFALLVVNPEPMAAFLAILGILVMSFLLILAGNWKLRRMEINYSME